MTLQTKRLLIRPLSIADLDKIHELHSLPETDRFNTLGIPDTPETTEKIINEWITEQSATLQTSYVFCVDILKTKEFIGLIALNLGEPKFKTAEVWYKTHLNYWGQGYTTEALTEILYFGFHELKLHRIEAGCAVENVASHRVLEKAGMTKEGIKRKKLPLKGEWKDSYFFAILEEDFKELSSLGNLQKLVIA